MDIKERRPGLVADVVGLTGGAAGSPEEVD